MTTGRATAVAPPATTTRRAIAMLVLAAAAWGLSFPGGKALVEALEAELPGRSSWFFAALLIGGRFALAALLLLAVQPKAFTRITRPEWKQGAVLGFCVGIGTCLQADALAYTHASTVAFLTQFGCVLIPLAVFARDRTVPSKLVMLCLALVIPGVAVLAQFNWQTLRFGRGELETLIGSAFFTVQVLALDEPSFRENDSGRVSLVMFLGVAAVLAPIAVWQAHGPGDFLALAGSVPLFAVFLVVTLICSVVAFLLMNRWQPELPATTAGIIYCLEPLFATVFALFLPALVGPWLGLRYVNETVTTHLLIGGTLITLANVLIVFQPRPRDHGSL